MRMKSEAALVQRAPQQPREPLKSRRMEFPTSTPLGERPEGLLQPRMPSTVSMAAKSLNIMGFASTNAPDRTDGCKVPDYHGFRIHESTPPHRGLRNP